MQALTEHEELDRARATLDKRTRELRAAESYHRQAFDDYQRIVCQIGEKYLRDPKQK